MGYKRSPVAIGMLIDSATRCIASRFSKGTGSSNTKGRCGSIALPMRGKAPAATGIWIRPSLDHRIGREALTAALRHDDLPRETAARRQSLGYSSVRKKYRLAQTGGSGR